LYIIILQTTQYMPTSAIWHQCTFCSLWYVSRTSKQVCDHPVDRSLIRGWLNADYRIWWHTL